MRTRPDPRTRRPGALPTLVLALLATGCATVVTPSALRHANLPADEREHVLTTWNEAVALANGYLASPYRHSMPAGRYTLDDELGMTFESDGRRWPIQVWNSFGGWLVTSFGFRAQERERGFVVGPRPPDEQPLVDHSMFRDLDGDWHSARSVASLVLHETAHTIHREGTVGFGNTLLYYLEAVFLLRTTDHSDERIPNAVSEEFRYWASAPYLLSDALLETGITAEQRLDEHMAQDHDDCRHGPAPVYPP